MSGVILSVFRIFIFIVIGIGFCFVLLGKCCLKMFFSVVKKVKLRFFSIVLCFLWLMGEMYIFVDELYFII